MLGHHPTRVGATWFKFQSGLEWQAPPPRTWGPGDDSLFGCEVPGREVAINLWAAYACHPGELRDTDASGLLFKCTIVHLVGPAITTVTDALLDVAGDEETEPPPTLTDVLPELAGAWGGYLVPVGTTFPPACAWGVRQTSGTIVPVDPSVKVGG